jgi:recombination protein RecA
MAARRRADTAARIQAAIAKEFGKGSAQLLREDQLEIPREVIPTGLEVLDNYVFGVGGLPVGRVIELYSEEGAGKTSFGHTFLGAAQRAGGAAVLVETEHAFDPTRAPVFGVEVPDLVVAQPDHLSQVMREVELLCDHIGKAKIGPSVVVWDSVAATPTQTEFEGGITGDGGHGADRARELSRAMRILTKKVDESRLVLVCINQIRENIGVMFGDKYTTAGGKAIKFHSSIRVQLLGGAGVKRGTEHVAKDITVMTVKNRLAPPFRKARVRLDYEHGWDNDWTTLNHAKDKGVVAKDAKVGKRSMKEAREALGWACPEEGGDS